MQILITGATGFVGKFIQQEFSKSNYGMSVVTLSTGNNHKNSSHHIQTDLLNPELPKILSKLNPNVVIHAAGKLPDNDNFKDSSNLILQNVVATNSLLEALSHCGNFHFIYVGSGAIYSARHNHSISENEATSPHTIYGATKLCGENIVRSFCESRGLEWTALTLSNCYGPIKDMKRGVISNFYHRLIRELPPVIHNSNIFRDFVHIDDVIRAVKEVIKYPMNSRVHISSNIATNLIELSEIMQSILNVSFPPIIQAKDTRTLAYSRLDNTKARNELLWSPKIGLKEGIASSMKNL